jgi:hypothetical protein
MLLVPDFPLSFGPKRAQIALLMGPASYTQVTPGSPPTGGQALLATNFGMKWIDYAFSGVSDDGQYEVVLTPTTNTTTGQVTWIAIWKVAHTGAEAAGATNLSARTVRIFLIGN